MSAVSLTATALAGTVLGCAVVGLLGQVAMARAEADAAADLAALAVASRVVRGEPHAVACALGRTIVTGPRTRLSACAVDGEAVSDVRGTAGGGPGAVTVQVVLDLDLLGTTLPVVATARAGPDPGPP